MPPIRLARSAAWLPRVRHAGAVPGDRETVGRRPLVAGAQAARARLGRVLGAEGHHGRRDEGDGGRAGEGQAGDAAPEG